MEGIRYDEEVLQQPHDVKHYRKISPTHTKGLVLEIGQITKGTLEEEWICTNEYPFLDQKDFCILLMQETLDFIDKIDGEEFDVSTEILATFGLESIFTNILEDEALAVKTEALELRT
ncbi:hypothetical protein NDU88_004448 [Pleurodeles waltl]|uniref:Uncharacterized protein n=1 Tax=Pleurodeles waltl TaxID=8319 RepID=A0AAV7UI90_PLEWA|nr:hypothetical protein NDU88_004448 [Pleurodeles waltl]